MKELPLTEAQRTFLNLMLTPHKDSGMRMVRITSAIRDAPESERIGFVTLFLQALFLPDRDEPAIEEELTYTIDQLQQSKAQLDACIRDGTVEFDAPFKQEVPLQEAAARVLRQLELLRPHGVLVQAWLLEYFANAGHLPYCDPSELPRPRERTRDQMWEVFSERPRLFASLYCIARQYHDDYLALGSCTQQLLVDEPDDIREIFLGLMHLITPKIQYRAMRKDFRALLNAARPAPMDEEDSVADAARNIDITDERKKN